MKIWRLVSGILSMISFLIITFQSCAVGFVNAIEENAKDTSDVAGLLVAFGLLISGIVATSLWKKNVKSDDISLIVLYGLTALIGFFNLGTFSDLVVWSSWALICAVMAAIALYLHSQEVGDNDYVSSSTPSSNVSMKECPNCHAVIDAGSAFCSSCGFRFPVQTFCRICGKQLKENEAFCTNCGTKRE